MNPSNRFIVLALSLALATLVPRSAAAQRSKLNGPLATAYLTDVQSFDSAIGRVVYAAGGALYTVPLNGSAVAAQFHEFSGSVTRLELSSDASRVVVTGILDGAAGIFSLPADGSGARVMLHPPLTLDSHIHSFRIASDDTRVVFEQIAQYHDGGATGLFSVPIDGSQPPVALNGGFPVSTYALTPDAQHVLFSDGVRLFTIPIEGGVAPLRVHGPLGGNRAVTSWELTPDGSRVVYRLNCDDWTRYEVYSAPVDGSAPQVKLNGALVAGGNVSRFQISPFSTHVTYAADQDLDGVEGLYGAPIAGGASVLFSAGVAGRSIVDARISPDRARMVYRANHGPAGRYSLFSVPVDGSQPPLDLCASIPGGDVGGGFLTDPLSGRLLFRVAEGGGTFGLYSATNDGSAPPLRLGPAGSSVGIEANRFVIASGSRALFLAESSGQPGLELFSAPLDGSTAASPLHPPLIAGGSVHSFVLDAAGGRALYRAEQDIDDLIELFVVPVDGSTPPELRSTIREHPSTVGNVFSFALTPDGTSAVYRAHEVSGDGLHAVNLEGSPQRIHLAPPGGDFQVTPDSQRLIYTGSGNSTIHSVPLDGSAAPTLIASSGELIGTSPDSSRVVHVQSTDFYIGPTRLFSTPVGGGPSVELNLPRTLNGALEYPRISPDSGWVVYTGIQETAGVVELFSAPLAGDAPAVKLNDTLVEGGRVLTSYPLGQIPSISPDSSRVVYLADGDVDGSSELHSAPIAGDAPSTELSTLPAPDRDVMSFTISPDSTRVVYVADQDEDEVYELYSVPLAGGAAPIELSAIPGGDMDVDIGPYDFIPPYLISPDSQWVVYRADQDVDGEVDLYRAPLAGGSAPERLTFGGTARLERWSPDSRHVVYAKSSPERTDLHRVSVDGATSVRLNGAFSVEGARAEIDASGRWVLFQARVAGVVELFAAPFHGLHPPLPVNGPLAGVTAVSGAFRPGARSVVYLAEQDEAGVVELYHNELLNAPDRRPVR